MTTNDSRDKGRAPDPVSPIGDKLLTRIDDLATLGEDYERGETQIERAARIAKMTLPTAERRPGAALTLRGLTALATAKAEADYIEALLIRYARQARVPWGEIATTLGLGSPQAAQSRWKVREGLLDDATCWQLPQGGLDDRWADAVAEQIGRHFEFDPGVRRGAGVYAEVDGFRNGKGPTGVVVTILDPDNLVNASVLDDLTTIKLKVVFPGPFDPARYVGDTDLAWMLHAESDEAEIDNWLFAPAWDEDPRRLGDQLAAALADYRHL